MAWRRQPLFPFLAIIFVLNYNFWIVSSKQTNVTTIIDREHVGVWFNHTHCFHGRDEQSPTCSKADMTLMARTVATKFGTILLDSPPPNSDEDDPSTATPLPSVWIPSIIAELNRNHFSPGSEKNRNSTRIFMSTRVDDVHFETVLRIADAANEIHPGTVTTLLFQYTTMDLRTWSFSFNYKLFFSNIPNSLRHARARLNNRGSSKHSYRLGLIIEQEDCWQFGAAEPVPEVLASVKDSLELADVVLVFLNFDLSAKFDYTTGRSRASTSVQPMITEFEECERQLLKLAIDKPEQMMSVIPFVACFSERRRNSLRKFLRCWAEWSEWGVAHGRQVVMYEAMDSHYALVYKHSGLHDLGWWRSVPGVPFGESSFVEKITELEEPVFLLERSDSLVVSVDHTVRYLRNDSPWKYTKAEVGAMMKLVTDKFPTVYYSAPSYWSPGNSSLLIPSIVAELNQNSSSYSSRTSNTTTTSTSSSPSALLSAMVAFEVSTRHDLDSWSSSLNSAKVVADQANGIAPGTVSTLVCQPPAGQYDRFHNLSRLVGFLPKARELLMMMSGSSGVGNESAGTGFPSYKLGIRMSKNECDEMGRMVTYRGWNEENVVKFLAQLDLVLVTCKIGENTRRMDAHGDRRHVQFTFDSCQEGLKGVRPTLRVVPALVCQESTEVQVVRCWQFAKEWADELGEQVVVFEAFDVPSQGRYAGWWKLNKVSNVNISRDSFVEKAQDVASEIETTSCVLNNVEENLVDFADAGEEEEEEESGNPGETSSEQQHQNEDEIEQDRAHESSQHPSEPGREEHREEKFGKTGELEKSDETGGCKGRDTPTQGPNFSQSWPTRAIIIITSLVILCATMFVVILGLGYLLVQARRGQGGLVPKATRFSTRIHEDESNPNLTVSTPDSLDVSGLVSNAISVAYTRL